MASLRAFFASFAILNKEACGALETIIVNGCIVNGECCRNIENVSSRSSQHPGWNVQAVSRSSFSPFMHLPEFIILLFMRAALLIFCILTALTAGAQQRKIDTTKYKIVLPSYWKPGNKVWEILTDALPKVCSELVDKEMCTDPCKALYTVDLFISGTRATDRSVSRKPGKEESYDIRTFYNFYAALFLKDTNGIILVDMVLVDTNEVWSVVHTVNHPGKPITTNSIYDGNNPLNMKPGQERPLNQLPPPSGTQNAYFMGEYGRKPEPYFRISENELYRIIHSKFLALKE